MNYPDDALQSAFDEWWLEDESRGFQRGRLVWAPMHNANRSPMELVAQGRDVLDDHASAKVVMQQAQMSRARPEQPSLPTAAIPLPRGETCLVYRAKWRPALVVSATPPSVKDVLVGSTRDLRHSPVLLAPYYGVAPDGAQAGYPPEFLRRVRRAEYPQFMWERLPIHADKAGSLLRLDQLQPHARSASTCRETPWRLSNDALEILDAWIAWMMVGTPPAGSLLAELREDFAQL